MHPKSYKQTNFTLSAMASIASDEFINEFSRKKKKKMFIFNH